MKDWAELLRMAYEEGKNSHDTSTQNGALLVDDCLRVVLSDHNRFPNGVNQDDDRWKRPAKYKYIEHAERNVIYRAAKDGIKTHGLYPAKSISVHGNN